MGDLEGSGCDLSDVQCRQFPAGTEENSKTYILTGHLLNAVTSYTAWLNTFGSQDSNSELN
jgi:hypothetical protein